MILFISLLLVTATSASALVVYLARQHPMPGRLPLLWMLLAVAVWSGGYALELISTGLSAKIFWNHVQYLGIVAIAPCWFAFVLSYTGIHRKFSARLGFLLASIPLITLFLVWTTDLHASMRSRVALVSYEPASLLVFDFGSWFWVHAAYAYLLLASGVALILRELWRSAGLHRLQAIMLLLGILPVWGANIVYLTEAGPHPHLDWTSLAFGITCAVYAWGLLQLHLLTLTPLARRTLLEERRDGVLVVDLDNRIVDLNPAVEQVAGLPRTALAGQPLSLLLGADAQDILAYKAGAWLPCELALANHHVHELQVSLLYSGDQQLAGKLVVLRDVTEIKQREAQLRHQNEYLAALHQISLDLLQRRELGELLQAVVERAAEILAAPYGELMLVDGDELVVLACTASMSFVKGERVTRDTAKLSWQAYDTKQPVILENYAAWSSRRAIYAASELHAVADYPILVNETCVGVLALGRSEPGYLFEADDVEKGLMFSRAWRPWCSTMRSCMPLPSMRLPNASRPSAPAAAPRHGAVGGVHRHEVPQLDLRSGRSESCSRPRPASASLPVSTAALFFYWTREAVRSATPMSGALRVLRPSTSNTSMVIR